MSLSPSRDCAHPLGTRRRLAGLITFDTDSEAGLLLLEGCPKLLTPRPASFSVLECFQTLLWDQLLEKLLWI